jgi:hypothetical protein
VKNSATRYISRVPTKTIRCEDDYWMAGRETLDVIIVSDDPVDTGLVDQHGVPIMRLSARAPMGFGR